MEYYRLLTDNPARESNGRTGRRAAEEALAAISDFEPRLEEEGRQWQRERLLPPEPTTFPYQARVFRRLGSEHALWG